MAALAIGIGGLGAPSPSAAAPGDLGEESQAYVDGTLATVTMSQSKLWFHDGTWFAAMLRTGTPTSGGSPDADVAVFRRSAGTWLPTEATIDVRATTKQDVVAVGDTLYVASHKKLDNETSTPETNPSNMTRLAKLTYDEATGEYAMADGFPVVMNSFQMEALTIDVDATGVLWAAWVQADAVLWQRSTDGGASWSAPTALPHPHARPTADDIAAVVAFGDRVGIMWAGQVGADDGYWFVSTSAGSGAPGWSVEEAAYVGPDRGDDHISIKAVGGRLVAAVKTRAGTASPAPGVVLLRRDVLGRWTSTTAWTGATRATRPIVVTDGALVGLYATMPGEGGGQGIYVKATSLAAPSLDPAAKGIPAMVRPVTGNINDASSTKGVLTSETGVAVIGSDTTTRRYWTSEVPGTPPPPPPPAYPPFASADAFTTAQAQAFLGRPPTAAELDQVRAALGAGGQSPASVVLGSLFLRSGAVGGPGLQGPQASVTRLYLAYFLRPPDRSGFDFWVARLSSGRSLEAISQDFARSPEFDARYGDLDDSGFVALVYRNLLERAPDGAGRAYWLDQLAHGVTRGRMMTLFSESPEYRQLSANRVVVSLAHRWMLGRMPTKVQMVAAAALSPEAAVAAILGGAEYRARLGL